MAFYYLCVHDGAAKERDAEEDRARHFEHFEPSVIVDGGHEANASQDAAHGNDQQNDPAPNTHIEINHPSVNAKVTHVYSLARLCGT